MNKKGFTLVELLAVVVIIAILASLAVPNIISMTTRAKNEQFITDAKQIIAKAKYAYKNGKFESSNTISLGDLEISLNKSPFGEDYDDGKSIIKVDIVEGNLIFSIYLTDNKYQIGKSEAEPVAETKLTNDVVNKCP